MSPNRQWPLDPLELSQSVEKRLAGRVQAIRACAQRIAAQSPAQQPAPGDGPPEASCASLCAPAGGRLQSILDEAERALVGQLVLPGTGGAPAYVGNPPQWKHNPGGDPEYTWSLNRMLHWPALLRAYSLTGDERYATKVISELEDWLEQCPRPALADVVAFGGPGPWRALEVGIRLNAGWAPILPHLIGTRFLPPDRLARLAESIRQQAEGIYVNSPKVSSPAHNHYLLEMAGLANAARLFPEFPESLHWAPYAHQELERCAELQLTADGGQIEGCPHYHNTCLRVLADAALAAGSAAAFSPAFLKQLEKAVDYTAFSTRPSGAGVPWGDSDATRSYPLGNLLRGYRLFGKSDYLAVANMFYGQAEVEIACNDLAWQFDGFDEVLAAAAALPRSNRVELPTLNWQKPLHQAMVRTDWSQQAASVFFACRTPVNNAHAHIDPNGFDFTALGRALVVDPGRYTYKEGTDRRDFKSATTHNTLTINEKEPFEYQGTWRYGPQQAGFIDLVDEQDGWQYAVGVHDNYQPARHTRYVALHSDSTLLVVDRVEHLRPGSTLDLHYHLDSTRVAWSTTARAVVSQDPGAANVLLTSTLDTVPALMPGRVSDAIDLQRASTRVRWTVLAGTSSWQAATLIIPFAAGATSPSCHITSLATDRDGIRCAWVTNGVARHFRWKG